MTDTWAFAAVTRSFTALLERVTVDDSSFSPVDVVSKAPERIFADDQGLTRRKLNLFLYQVTPNPALVNAELPVRGADGQLVAQPTMAMDLHYLLTAYGVGHDELDAQHLLAHAMSIVHDNGVLHRQHINAALSGTPMAGSNLAQQLEGVRLTPATLSDEELFRMWNVFGSTYRISVGYTATVVLVERPKPTRTAPPVRSRTLTVGTIRPPRIDRIDPERPTAETSLTVHGSNLAADAVTVRLSTGDVAVAPADVSDTALRVTLPAGLAAGPNTLQVLHARQLSDAPTETRPFVASDVFGFLLVPRIISSLPATAPRGGTLTLTLDPPAARGQRVRAILGTESLLRRVAPGDPAADATVEFSVPSDLSPGSRTLRMEIDGAESQLTHNAEGVYSGPRVDVT
jgi:hypothetical protein